MKKILLVATCIFYAGICAAQIPTDYAWAKKAGGTGTEEGKAIAADGKGHVIIGGYYKNTATFGTLPTITAVTGHDAFVAKYDSTGSALWVNSIGGTDTDEMTGVSYDSLGNVYAVGVYGTAITAGTTTFTSAGSIDFFIAKYSPSGTLTWIKSIGSINSDYAYAIRTDMNGNSYVAGKFNTSTNIGGVPLSAVGQDDIFIAKFDSAGSVVWAKNAGSTSSDFAKGISLDASGNIYVTGNFSGTATFYGTPNVALTTGGQWDVFIAKYDPLGNVLWAKKGGGTNHDHGLGIDTDANGNSTITGYYQSTSAVFNGVTLTNAGNWEMFVARFNTTGTQTWAKKFGGAQYDYAYGVTVDKNKQILITGGFGATVAFGTFTLTSTNATTEDLFITKLDTTGTVLWAMKAGAPANEYTWGNAITSDQFGGVYATGSYEGTATFGTTLLNSSGGDEAYGEDIFVCKIDQAAITTFMATSNFVGNNFFVFPTLTTGAITIRSEEVMRSVIVYNSNGQEVFRATDPNTRSFTLELGNKAEGVYFIHVSSEKGTLVKKIVLSY